RAEIFHRYAEVSREFRETTRVFRGRCGGGMGSVAASGAVATDIRVSQRVYLSRTGVPATGRRFVGCKRTADRSGIDRAIEEAGNRVRGLRGASEGRESA